MTKCLVYRKVTHFFRSQQYSVSSLFFSLVRTVVVISLTNQSPFYYIQFLSPYVLLFQLVLFSLSKFLLFDFFMFTYLLTVSALKINYYPSIEWYSVSLKNCYENSTETALHSRSLYFRWSLAQNNRVNAEFADTIGSALFLLIPAPMMIMASKHIWVIKAR